MCKCKELSWLEIALALFIILTFVGVAKMSNKVDEIHKAVVKQEVSK